LEHQQVAGVMDTSNLVDLQTASLATLTTRLALNARQASALIAYRDAHGPINKLWQLASLPGFGEKTVRSLQGRVMPLIDAPLTTQSRRLRCSLPLIARPHGDALIVGSWNIQRLSLSKPDFALHIIAAVARCMDIMAVQEVIDDRVLSKLLMLLPGWRCIVSQPQGNAITSTYVEQYAFLWNAESVAMVGTPGIVTVRNVTRSPFVCSFARLPSFTTRPVQQSYTAPTPFPVLTVANFHAVYGKTQEIRKMESLAVRQSISVARDRCIDVLLGDFNCACDGDAWEDTCQGWTRALPLYAGTTLAKKPWDHIWCRVPLCDAGVMDYAAHVRTLDPSLDLGAVSDHLPIYATVSPQRQVFMPLFDAAESRTNDSEYNIVQTSKVWLTAAVAYGRYGETSSRVLC
jgi:endonuclease/exonuclease/phosphatase family metal-dependent hydrolase